jgi:hypothetical protein
MATYKVYINQDQYVSEIHAATFHNCKDEKAARRKARDYMRRWDLDWQGCKIQKVVRVS